MAQPELTRLIEQLDALAEKATPGQLEFLAALCNAWPQLKAAALAHLRAGSAWIPVSERLPEPYIMVVLWAIRDGGYVSGPPEWHRGAIDSGGSYSFAGYSAQHWKVTHWMPQPSPPAGEGTMVIKDDGGFLP